MLRSLIRQLSLSPLSARTRTLRDRHKTPGSSPDLEELTAALLETIESLEDSVFIVIDALDECPNQRDTQSERKELLSLIQRLTASGPRNFRLLATSRYQDDIGDALRNIQQCRVINIEQLVKEDVTQFVKRALTERPLKFWRSEVRYKIEERLLATDE